MKTKITIEIEIELNDFVNLPDMFKDISYYLEKGVQSRATCFRNADYNYHVHVPVRKGAKINFTEDKIIFTHKSKMK